MSVSSDEVEIIKEVCRQLSSINILEVGGAPIGTSGTRTNSATSSKRRRSGSREVLKVKLLNQQVKKEVKEAIDLGVLKEFLNELVTQE